MDPGGHVTGKLLPSGSILDTIAVDGADYEVSLVDSVNPVVLIHATSLPAPTPWDLAGIESDRGLNDLLEKVRRVAAVRFGLAGSEATAGAEAAYIPFVGMYWDRRMVGRDVPSAIKPDPSADAAVRLMSGGLPHRVVPLSAGLATATLTRLRDLAAGAAPGSARIRLEHPSGLLDIDVDALEGGPVRSVGVTQTARRIMEGDIFIV
jgi:2-methylaconitate cis-trans-isomerase PrpF